MATDQEIRRLIREMQTPGYKKQDAAMRSLAEIGTPAVPALIDALKDTDGIVVMSVARILGTIGDARAVSALVGIMEDAKQHHHIKEDAAIALGKIAERNPNIDMGNAARTLAAAMKEQEKEQPWEFGPYGYGLRVAAAQALGEIGDASVIPEMIKGVANDNARLCWATCDAFGKIGDASAVPYLLRVIEKATNPFQEGSYGKGAVELVREALNKIAAADPSSHRMLEQAMRHGNNEVRKAAYDAITSIEQRQGQASPTPTQARATRR